MGKPTLSQLPPIGFSEEQKRKWKEEKAERDYQVKLENQRRKFEPAFRNKKIIQVLNSLEKKNPNEQTLFKT